MQVKMMPMHQAYWGLNSLVLEDCRPCWKEIDRKDMVTEEGNDATFLRVSATCLMLQDMLNALRMTLQAGFDPHPHHQEYEKTDLAHRIRLRSLS